MRLIDADALIAEANQEGAYGYVDAWDIAHAPTVDDVPVVRCVECKWWKCADDSEIIKYGDCTHPSSAIRKNCLPNETWYCADGEVRDDATD